MPDKPGSPLNPPRSVEGEQESGVRREMQRRYAYFPGEHPDRGKIRLTIETEPMARWLAETEIAREQKACLGEGLSAVPRGLRIRRRASIG